MGLNQLFKHCVTFSLLRKLKIFDFKLFGIDTFTRSKKNSLDKQTNGQGSDSLKNPVLLFKTQNLENHVLFSQKIYSESGI